MDSLPYDKKPPKDILKELTEEEQKEFDEPIAPERGILMLKFQEMFDGGLPKVSMVMRSGLSFTGTDEDFGEEKTGAHI